MSDDARLAKKAWLQALSLLALVFLVGALTGGAVERIRAVRSALDQPWLVRGQRPPAELNRLPRPFEQLDLSDDQRQGIVEVFEASRPLTDSIMAETMPRLRAIRDSVSLEIRALLTEEQLDQLDREFGDWLAFPGRFPGPMMRPGLPDSMRRRR